MGKPYWKTHNGRLADHAQALLIEAGRDFRSITFHDKTSRGQIQKRGGHIHAPYPSTRRRLMTLAHECAHAVLHFQPNGTGGWDMTAEAAGLPLHIQEYQAETWVARWFASRQIDLDIKEAAIGKQYVAICVVEDVLAGLDIDPVVLKWLNLEAEHYLEIWAMFVDQASVDVPQPLLDWMDVPDAMTAREFRRRGALRFAWDLPGRKWIAIRMLLRYRAAAPAKSNSLLVRAADRWNAMLPRWMQWASI